MHQTASKIQLPPYLKLFFSVLFGLLSVLTLLALTCLLILKNPQLEDYIPLFLWGVLLFAAVAFGSFGGFVFERDFALFFLSALFTALTLAGVSLLFGGQVTQISSAVLRPGAYFGVSILSDVLFVIYKEKRRSRTKRSALRKRKVRSHR